MDAAAGFTHPRYERVSCRNSPGVQTLETAERSQVEAGAKTISECKGQVGRDDGGGGGGDGSNLGRSEIQPATSYPLFLLESGSLRFLP